MLPGLSGLEVCRALRADNRTAALPIIMLTARGEESERILGLDSGADDYIVKPFSPNELMARVRALLRRATPPEIKERILRCGPISVDVERHTVSDNGEHVRLTAKEFLLLQYLLEHRGRVLVARSAALRRLGLSVPRRHAHRRRARQAPARKAAVSRTGSRHGAAVRLQARRTVTMFDAVLYLVVALVAGLAGYRLGTTITHGRMRDRETRASGESAQLDAPSERARDRPRAHGRHPVGHGRRRARRRRRRTAAPGERRRAAHAEPRKRPARAPLRRGRAPAGRRGAARRGAQRRAATADRSAARRGESPAGPRIFRAQATPASAEGGGAVLVLHDISDLRRADRVRRDFVANVSHELRTPLTAVRGYVEALDGRAGRARAAAQDSSRSSIATPREWSAWCAICCGWRGWTRSRKPPTYTRSTSPRCSIRPSNDLSERIERQRAAGRHQGETRRGRHRSGSRRRCTTRCAI